MGGNYPVAIYFYRGNESYGCFSNFSRRGFHLDGKYWPTSEHYFQAQKFAGTEYEERIRLASGPREAARLGRDRSLPIRSDWVEVRDDVMRRAVMAKFETYEDIRQVLLDTGDEVLIERTTDDYYWGCGRDGSGVSKLGQILMEVREALRQQWASP